MEQIQELFEILKSTPEMALYGLLIWCLYILAKLASVVFAIKIVFQQAINKWHDYKIKKLDVTNLKLNHKIELSQIDNQKIKIEADRKSFIQEKELSDIRKLAKRFNKQKISDVEFEDFIRLIDAIKSTSYIHQSDMDKAIRLLTASKKSA